MKTKREIILDTVSDLVANFVYYDRKEDEELSPADLDEALKMGDITVEDIVNKFNECIRETYDY